MTVEVLTINNNIYAQKNIVQEAGSSRVDPYCVYGVCIQIRRLMTMAKDMRRFFTDRRL